MNRFLDVFFLSMMALKQRKREQRVVMSMGDGLKPLGYFFVHLREAFPMVRRSLSCYDAKRLMSV